MASFVEPVTCMLHKGYSWSISITSTNTSNNFKDSRWGTHAPLGEGDISNMIATLIKILSFLGNFHFLLLHDRLHAFFCSLIYSLLFLSLSSLFFNSFLPRSKAGIQLILCLCQEAWGLPEMKWRPKHALHFGIAMTHLRNPSISIFPL